MKYLGESAYKGKTHILTHGFNLWSLGPVAFGPVERQYIMVKGIMGKPLTSWWPESKEGEREGWMT